MGIVLWMLILSWIPRCFAAASFRKQPQHSTFQVPQSAFDGSNTTALASVLAEIANDCQCSFRGVCTCELELEFMNCVRDACDSGKCACDGHFADACDQMGAACPQNKLQCSESKEVTCMSAGASPSSQPLASESTLATTLPATLATTLAPAIPQSIPLTRMIKESLQSWATRYPYKWAERVWALLVYIVFGILFAFLYYRKEIAGAQASWGVKHVQPGYAIKTPSTYRESEWNTSLFDCFYAKKLCCYSCCCPCLIWADTADKSKVFKGLSYWRAFAIFFFLMSLSNLTGGFTSILIAILGVIFRQAMRKQYNMVAGGVTIVHDFFTWCCCMPCAVVQERSEEHIHAVHQFARLSPRSPRASNDLVL